MATRANKILVVRGKDRISLSIAMDMIYLSLLPYSQQSRVVCGPDCHSEYSNDTILNGNAAYLIINNCKVGIISYVDTKNQYGERVKGVSEDGKCDYIICCIDDWSGDYSIYEHIVEIYEEDMENISYLTVVEDTVNDHDYLFHEIRHIVYIINSLCDITEKQPVKIEHWNELIKSIKKYVSDYYSEEDEQPKITSENAEDAYNSLNAEWSRLIKSTLYNSSETEQELSTLYGQALLVFAKSTEHCITGALSIGRVTSLTALIYHYEWETKDNPHFSIKKYLYLSLAICRRLLGREYESYAIVALRFYLFNMFATERGQRPSNKEIYGFRKVSKHFLGALIGHTLNVTSPYEFNDPFDTPILGKYNGNYVGEMIRKAYKDTLKVACFSNNTVLAKPDEEIKAFLSPLMWAHYADNHKGVCIKYCFTDESINDENTNTRIVGFKQIKYSNTDLANCGKNSSISKEDAFFLKGEAWSYENECRLFCFDLNGTGKFDKYVDTTECIEAVYFGLRCPKEDMKAIIQILRCRKNFTAEKELTGTGTHGKDIEFFEMQMNPDKFGELKEQKLEDNDIEALLS